MGLELRGIEGEESARVAQLACRVCPPERKRVNQLVCWDAHYRPKLSFSDSEKYLKSARYSNPIFSDDQRLLNLEANVATY